MILDEEDICSKESMKLEAIKRMKKLNIRDDVIEAFKNNDLLLCSSYEEIKEIPPKILKNIKDWEKKFGNLVFHVIYSELFGCIIYNALSVSLYMEDWDYENEILEIGWSMAYTINETIPQFSESGSILLKNSNGILHRIN